MNHQGAKAETRPVYSHAELDRLLNPKTIAIVGASEREGSFGNRLMKNLSDFTGTVYLVNGRYEEIDGRKCYASVSALPESPDCVITATAREVVEDVVRECVEAKAGGVVIFASGYAETGKPENILLQSRLTEIVAGTPTRIVGPNCLGLFNYGSGAWMSFSPRGEINPVNGHAIGIVSQSGAMGTALAQNMAHGVSISHTLTSGNSCDVDVADLVSFLAEEPSCKAIACIFEGMAEPERLLEAARKAWAADKPLLVYKMATGDRGAQAAMSHTGSLAGSNEAYRAAFESVGIIQVASHEDLIETATFFAKVPSAPLAKGTALISTSGGAGIIGADKAEENGVWLPDLRPETEAFLATIIPDFGSPKNPCDLTAQALNDPESLKACSEAICSEPDIGVIVYSHPMSYDAATPRMAQIGSIAASKGRAFCTVWLNGWLEGPGAADVERNPQACLFRTMDRCFTAIRLWNERAALRALLDADSGPLDPPAASREAKASLSNVATKVVDEFAAKNILNAYGLPTVPEKVVNSASEAVAAAKEIGFPVTAKLLSADVPHKSEAGMVLLNLRTAEEVSAAYDDIVSRAGQMTPKPRIEGVVIQAMVPQGVELLIGGRTDPMFGPLIVFGFGGTMVEVLKDTVTALAPLSRTQARSMLGRLRAQRMLNGYRHLPPVDLDAFADAIAAASVFLADNSEEVAELDINPIIASQRGLFAVDGLIVKDTGN